MKLKSVILMSGLLVSGPTMAFADDEVVAEFQERKSHAQPHIAPAAV